MSQQYLYAIGLSLLVALYMFAAIPFPALRFIFRLKRGVARMTGTSDAANKGFGDTLGLVLCPIIGIGALCFAGYYAMEWRNTIARQRAHEELVAKQAQMVGDILAHAKLGKVNIGNPYLQRIPTDAGRSQIEAFFRELAPTITPAALTSPQSDGANDVITMEFASSAATQIKASPKTGSLALKTESGNWGINVPDSLRDSMTALGRIEQIDLIAARRQEEKKKADAELKIVNYIEVAHQGPASWQIYEAVASEPVDNRAAKGAEFAGVPIDWELRISFVKEEGDQFRVVAIQSRPSIPQKPGIPMISPAVHLLVAKAKLADLKIVPRQTWVRVTGKVESVPVQKPDFTGTARLTVQLEVDNLTAFQPDPSKAAP